MKKIKDYTIKEIKTILADSEHLDANFMAALSKDSRKGVQKLVKQKNKQIEQIKRSNEDRIKRLKFEKELWSQGFEYVAGVDEVGRGPLAGPVYAAAVILPKNITLNGINDSKQLSNDQRMTLYSLIKEHALDYGIGSASVEEIDQLNIKKAARLAMKRAVENLQIRPDYILVDAEKIQTDIPQKSIIKGDSVSYTIGAASIMSKVIRDQVMIEYGKKFPGYGFERNVGYGTKEHLNGLKTYGVTSIHRKSFAPVKNLIP